MKHDPPAVDSAVLSDINDQQELLRRVKRTADANDQMSQRLIARQIDGLTRLPAATKKEILAQISKNKQPNSLYALNEVWAIVEAPVRVTHEVITPNSSPPKKTNPNLTDEEKRLLRKTIKSTEALQRNSLFPPIEVFELFRGQMLDLLYDASMIGTHARCLYTGAVATKQSLNSSMREAGKLQKDREKIQAIVNSTPLYKPKLNTNKLKKIAGQLSIDFNPNEIGDSLHIMRCAIARKYIPQIRGLNREIKDTKRGSTGQKNLITKLEDLTRKYDQNLKLIVCSINELHRGARPNHIDAFYDNLEYRKKQLTLRCQGQQLESKSSEIQQSEGIVEDLFLWWRAFTG